MDLSVFFAVLCNMNMAPPPSAWPRLLQIHLGGLNRENTSKYAHEAANPKEELTIVELPGKKPMSVLLCSREFTKHL